MTPIPFGEDQDPRTPEEVAAAHIEALDGCRTTDDVAAWAKPRKAWAATLPDGVVKKSLSEAITMAAERTDTKRNTIVAMLRGE